MENSYDIIVVGAGHAGNEAAAAAAGEGAGCPLSQLVPSEALTPFLECFSFNSASKCSRGGGSWAEEEEHPDSAVFGGIRDFAAIWRRDRMQEERLSFVSVN